MCGGIAGLQCCSGLECHITDHFPDAAGTCVESVCHTQGQDCGGFTVHPHHCCEGYGCVYKHVPDIPGECEKIN